MKHYGISQWVDFARGVASDEIAAMRAHLSSGCEDCQRDAQFCLKLVQACQELPKVPESVSRNARAIFATSWPDRPARAHRLPLQLIYDSFLVPVAAGLRASWQVGWQGLFHAGDCSVDVRIEPELRSARAALIGQISNHVAPDTEMADIAVCLKAGKSVIAETRSNRFGEFQMEYDQQKSLNLFIYLDGGEKFIQVPLKRLASEKPFSGERLTLGTGPLKKRLADNN